MARGQCKRAATAFAAAAAVAVGVGAVPAQAAWLGAADLAPANPAGKPVGPPSVAMAPDGTAFAAFQHYDGTNYRAGVVMRVPGGGFGPVADLSPAGSDAFDPVLAVDPQGNATVAWLQGPGSVVDARSRPAGGDWGATTTLSAGSVVVGPTIAAGANGGAVVAWWRTTGSGVQQVQAAVRPSSALPFGAAQSLSSNSGTACRTPRVAMDAAGDVAAIWTRRTPDPGAQYHVESAVKPAAAGVWNAPEARSPTSGSTPSCLTDIQMTADGRVTAVWDFNDGAMTPSYAAYADRSTPFASGAWSASAKLSVPTADSTQPLLAFDGAGNATAIWLSGGQILAALRTGLGGFSPPAMLSGASAALSGQAVAASADGDSLAAFIGTSNGNDAVFAVQHPAGGGFGSVLPVATTPPGGATVNLDSPAVAMDDQGNGFAVWERHVSGAETYSAQVAAFDPVAPVITAASVPASAVAGQPVAMSAAAADRMSGVALHFAFGDGSGADGGAVQHIYGAAGSYTVTVTATDAAGNESSATRTVQVVAPAPLPSGGPGPAKTVNRVAALASLSWDRLSTGRTRLKTLVIQGLAGPETVKLVCSGKHLGCRKAATKTVRKHGRTVSFTKAVKGMTLRPKAKLTITVSRPGFVGRVITYTMVSHRDPKKSTRCLAPGAKKTRAC